ncbi:F-box/kelch-repeat protein At3g23880-like [Lycium ferocissimum]|uniref:F-box/kelch-repeat protein At3g23880-like n=1 Tax=Lycium ferocissimum TaxID=112874 RepID=UPI0028157883|nr:F-box/kelch-repeat protein At3g23880-like [Lycium ferocissimum]
MENQNQTINQITELNPTKFYQELLKFSCLPDEIIIEILLRLPVKSVLKFRCVSKSWLSLLSSSHFVKTQIKFSIKDYKNVNFRLVVVASASGLVGKMCSIYSIVCEKSSFVNVAKIDYPLKPPVGSAKFLGSCNGLICLTAMSFKLMLWNPCTGNYKEFQDSIVKSAVSCYIRYGFGYDAINDDYKVVKIFSFPKDEGKYENMVKIYSLRSNSWKMSESFSGGYINAQSGVILNEALHWEVSHCRGSGAHSEIMTLDLATETYGVMELPSCGDGNVSWTLSVLGGRLVACCNYYPDKTDMWVMKEYGVEKSWTKLVSLSSPSGRMGYISPLFVSENGDEVLVKLGTDISLYDKRNASYKSLEIHASGCCLQVQAVTYFESLASPHIGDK